MGVQIEISTQQRKEFLVETILVKRIEKIHIVGPKICIIMLMLFVLHLMIESG